jgi:hypothetical protein
LQLNENFNYKKLFAHDGPVLAASIFDNPAMPANTLVHGVPVQPARHLHPQQKWLRTPFSQGLQILSLQGKGMTTHTPGGATIVKW